MFAIGICLVLLMCTLTIWSSVLCIDGPRYVFCSVCNVVSNECNGPPLDVCNLSAPRW